MQPQVLPQNMFKQSISILSKPGADSFRKCLGRGNRMDAAIYVGIAALIPAFLGRLNLSQVGSSMMSIITAVLATLLMFFLITWLVSVVGEKFGGHGNFDEVAYAFSLFYAPLFLGFWLITELLNFFVQRGRAIIWFEVLTLIAYGVFTYFAVQASMRFQKTSGTLITIGLTVVLIWVITRIFSRIVV